MNEELKIPEDMSSCHNTIIGDYFVVGHMPIEAITKLFTEKPNIDGIALPEMPSGSPGMSGSKMEIFKIYAISDGKATEFMSL